jgi:hypothetical protein
MMPENDGTGNERSYLKDLPEMCSKDFVIFNLIV